MDVLEKVLGWLRGNDFDTFSVRWQKTGSWVSLGILVACSLFYGVVKLRELITHRKNTIDRSLEYDIAEWIQGDGSRMLAEDADVYEKVLPHVFRRSEYRGIREEYETTLSAKRKESLFRQALIVLHQEIALHRAHRTEQHTATGRGPHDPCDQPPGPDHVPAAQPGASEDSASGYDYHERMVAYYRNKYSALGFSDAEIDDMIVRILEDR